MGYCGSEPLLLASSETSFKYEICAFEQNLWDFFSFVTRIAVVTKFISLFYALNLSGEERVWFSRRYSYPDLHRRSSRYNFMFVVGISRIRGLVFHLKFSQMFLYVTYKPQTVTIKKKVISLNEMFDCLYRGFIDNRVNYPPNWLIVPLILIYFRHVIK